MSEHPSKPRPCHWSIAQAMVFESSWTESIQRWRWSLVGVDGGGWTVVLPNGTETNALNIVSCCIAGVPRLCAGGVAGIAGQRKGLLDVREITAIVSLNVLLVSERSLFDSART